MEKEEDYSTEKEQHRKKHIPVEMYGILCD